MTAFRSTIPNRIRHEDQYSNTTILSHNMEPITEMDNTGGVPETESESQDRNTLPYYDVAGPSAIPTYLGGSNYNMDDGSGLLPTYTTYSNNTTHNALAWSGPDSMILTRHASPRCVDEYSGAFDGTDRVATPESFDPNGRTDPSSVSARKSRKGSHDEAHRAKDDRKSTKRKKNSTDSYLSMKVHQGSDSEFDKHERYSQKPKDKKNKHKDGRDEYNVDQYLVDGPWNSVVEDQNLRSQRISQNVFNPNLPLTVGTSRTPDAERRSSGSMGSY